MEPPNENQLSSYFHHLNHQPTAAANSPTNGLLPTSAQPLGPSSDGSLSVYPHSLPSAVASQPEAARRKRGRPRKYGTPEQALAAKKATTAAQSSSSKERKEQGFGAASSSAAYSSSSKKSQLDTFGNAGHGFTPHVISVSAGEDVAQKIMFFMQQSMREICILSASGTISNASLRQPATSGGNIAYEGRFGIVSLSGSYIRTELGGRAGGLSACLASSDGQIIGGGVGGPLKAAGPVEVIIGTFMLDNKKEITASLKSDTVANPLALPLGGPPVAGLNFRPTAESSGRNAIRGNGDHQTIGGGHFMVQPQGLHRTPSQPMDWRDGLDAREASGYDLTGRMGHACQSPENGDYNHIPD